MSNLILFHGSTKIIEKPIYGKGKSHNDYGSGFYCTEHIELANEWACTESMDGYANRYVIETDRLAVMDLSDEQYSILNWLAILMQNRIGHLSSPDAKRGRDYLIENFLPNYAKYDVIIGYRADDSYFSFARAFVANEISLKQLECAMLLGKLGEQYVLKSEKAFDAIQFIDYTIAENAVYYAKRKARDYKVRAEYLRELEKDDMNGIYLRDIIREGMKQHDERLR